VADIPPHLTSAVLGDGRSQGRSPESRVSSTPSAASERVRCRPATARTAPREWRYGERWSHSRDLVRRTTRGFRGTLVLRNDGDSVDTFGYSSSNAVG